MIDTREYIIEKAYYLFLNHSYEAVTISDISKVVGLTKGALYHHFKNKEDLYKAVIDKHLNLQIEVIHDENITLLECIDEIVGHSRKVINTIVSEDKQFMTLNYLSIFIDALRHYPKFIKEKGNITRDSVLKIRNILTKAIESGEIRKDIDADVMAMNFFSLSLSMVADLLHNNSAEQAVGSLRCQLMELYKLIKN